MSAPSADPALELRDCLLAVGTGDQTALRTLYARTSAKLFGVCLRILSDQGEAEEVLQEVYITVWRKAGLYDPGKAGAIAWLVSIARNKALDRVRSGRVRRLSVPVEAAEEIADAAPDAFDQLSGGQDRQALRLCMDQLEPDARSVIRAAFFDGATYQAVAETRGTPLGTIKSVIRRSLLKLRTCLGGTP